MPREASAATSRKRKLLGEKPPERPSPTTRIEKIASLQRKADKSKALDILHELASHVTPVLQKYNLKVNILREMYPKNGNLLGLNVNRGATILIRLRYHSNDQSFLPMGDLIGTMLHELVHNTFGPHDNRFYNLLDEYKKSYHMVGLRGSFAVTGQFSIHQKLGGTTETSRNIADLKSLRLKKYQSKKQYISETRRLGISDVDGKNARDQKITKAKSLKELIREAAERREKDSKWCSSNSDYKGVNEEFVNDELKVVEEEDYARQVKNKHSGKDAIGGSKKTSIRSPSGSSQKIYVISDNESNENVSAVRKVSKSETDYEVIDLT